MENTGDTTPGEKVETTREKGSDNKEETREDFVIKIPPQYTALKEAARTGEPFVDIIDDKP